MSEKKDQPPIYKWEWMNEFNPSYVVYRHIFDLSRCTLEAGIRAHKVALFITESEAADYCEYRNHMTWKYGSDDVDLILDYDA